ncbi:MAG: hypothetical protein ACYDH6_03490 [Acidimicrobiales bacterium]
MHRDRRDDIARFGANGHESPPVGPAHPQLRELWEARAETEAAVSPWPELNAIAPASWVPVMPRAAPTRAPRHLAAIAAGVAAACLVGGMLAAAAMVGRGSPWPSKWDPRVAAIASFDESHRHLRFAHPVPVEFLTDAAFRQKLAGTAAPSAGDRADAQVVVEELRALGLASGSPDLISGSQALAGSDVLGFYDWRAKKVWVRGTVLTPYVRVVLAHELTHVLQDQNFGLKRSGDDAGAAYTALIEADAVRIEGLYRKSLSAADQAIESGEERALGAPVQQAAAPVPAALVEGQQFPYQLGPHFVAALIDAKGEAGLDAAFRKPPTSTMEIIEPSRFLAADAVAAVPAPALTAHEQGVQPASTGGAFQLFEILADRLDLGAAWKGARTWAGDSSVAYRANGRTCVRLDVATVADPAPLVNAFRSWVAAAHNGVVTPTASHVRLDACDPGPNAAAGPSPTVGALDALDLRGSVAEGLGKSAQLTPAQVDCVADAMVQVASGPGLRTLVDLATSKDSRALAAFFADLGLRARPVARAECPSG